MKKVQKSIYHDIVEQPKDKIFCKKHMISSFLHSLALNALYMNDKFKDKVSLNFGVYRTKEGNPYVIPIV